MSFSLVYRFSIAALVALSVAWKIAVYSTSPEDSIGRVSSFLTKNDFVVAPPEQFLNTGMSAADASTISATNNVCRLKIAQLTADGSNRRIIEARLSGAEHHFVVFRGTVYPEPPEYAILVSYIWSRFTRELGVSSGSLPVIVVASNTSCNAEGLPWGEL